MIEAEAILDFFHSAHIFASTVRDILEEKFLRQATDLKLTVPQFNLIRLIAVQGDYHICDIARVMGVSQAAASKNVDKLVRLGLLARRVHPTDRRVFSLSLTVRGRHLVQRYETLKKERLCRCLEGTSAEELRALARAIERVAHLILSREQDSRDICIRCNAYPVAHCLLKDLSGGCIYDVTKTRTGDPPGGPVVSTPSKTATQRHPNHGTP